MPLQQEIFEPGEYLDQRGPGFFSILAKPDGTARQDSYELALLPKVVKAADPRVDTWITQATFNQANRRAVNMQSVGLLFADLDTYHVEGLRNKSPEDQAHELAAFCQMEGLPLPSIVLFSGRGLQAKWLLSEAIGPIALHDWNGAQIALVRLLEPFAADRAARDISRVLRLDRTTNTKSGEQCRVVYTSSGVENCLARYDFQELFENLTDRYPQPKPKERRIRPVLRSGELTFQRLNWYRLFDLRDLWNLRGGCPEGWRELTLFWELNFLLRAEPGKLSEVWAECETLAKEINAGAGWYRNGDLSTVYRKAKDMRDGITVEYRGREYPPLYTPRNQTLIELFQITPAEETKLRTIISKDEKYRRKVEKRRAEGIKERTRFGDVKPWEAEGISRRTWYYRQEQRPTRERTLSATITQEKGHSVYSRHFLGRGVTSPISRERGVSRGLIGEER